MVITFFNQKGGTGKTTLAMSVSKDLDFFLVSNDDSGIEELCGKDRAVILDKEVNVGDIEVNDGQDITFDLGGYIAEGVEDVIKASDVIVVPMTLDGHSVSVTMNTLKEALKYNKSIIVVLNLLTNERIKKYKQEIKEVEETIKAMGLPVFKLRSSEALFESSYTGKSFLEKCEKSPLSKYSYRFIYKEYKALLEEIKTRRKD